MWGTETIRNNSFRPGLLSALLIWNDDACNLNFTFHSPHPRVWNGYHMSVVTNMLRTQKRADDPFMYQYNCLSAETSTTNKNLSPHLTTISERALNHNHTGRKQCPPYVKKRNDPLFYCSIYLSPPERSECRSYLRPNKCSKLWIGKGCIYSRKSWLSAPFSPTHSTY